MEGTWQMLPGGWEPGVAWKRPDIRLSDRLFIGAVVNMPREQRPWGSITWLADVFSISRETVYAIGRRARDGFLSAVVKSSPRVERMVPVAEPNCSDVPTIAVTDNRLKRTILTAFLPGGVALRPMQDLLDEAFDQSRAVGFLSEFINEAGRRAGEILDQIDYSPLGEVILARDELYFAGLAFLLAVEPRSYVIVSGHVEAHCDGETWGVSLAIDQQTRGLRIIGLAEDAARYYPKSLQQAAALLEAEFSVAVQKDVWHVLVKARQTVIDLERIALKLLEAAEQQYQALANGPWDDEGFEAWVQAEEAADTLLGLSDQLRFWYGCLCDALELVDWRSGEIRDREINQWVLGETLQALRQLDHPRVQKLVRYLENHYDELLTFLDWLEVQLIPWQRRLARAFPDPQQRTFFQAAVARAWRLSRAVVNGHQQFQNLAADAQALVAELIADDEQAHLLAEELLTILEGTIRTSCAAETINSILRLYLWAKRSFQSRETAQNFLNLFFLWFNMHPFKRGKRAGKSPFQWAGIKVFTPDGRETDDWLEALGYPADA
jgi:hypothetical protein